MDMDMVQRPSDGDVQFETEVEFISVLYFESAFLMLLFIAGLLANVPVLILYFRSKHIRSITDKFLLNLLLADFVSVILLFPMILSSFVQTTSSSLGSREDLLMPFSSSSSSHSQFLTGRNTQQFPFNITTSLTDEDDVEGNRIVYEHWKWSCALSNGILAGLATASVLAALEIAMERYLAVVKPLHYHKLLTAPSILVTSIIGGAISLATAIIASVDPNFSIFPHCIQQQVQRQDGGSGGIFERDLNNHLVGPEKFLSLSSNGERESDMFTARPSLTNGDLAWLMYSLATTIFLFVVPVILMLYIYSKIWMEARRQRIKMRNQYKPYFLPVPPEHIMSKESEGKKGIFFPILVKFRRMTILRATRLDRAGRVAVVALVVTILCWSPYYFLKTSRAIQILLTMYGYESLSSSYSTWSWSTTVLPLIFAALHPVLSPLFYAYRYKRLRTEIFRCISPNNESNRWDGNCGRGGFTSTAMHTNASSISGGTPCIRQAIITQNHPQSLPPTPPAVLTGQQYDHLSPPSRVIVMESEDDHHSNLVQEEDGVDLSVPREKVGGNGQPSGMEDQVRSYNFHTPTSNICINIFSSEEFDDNQGHNRALDLEEDNDHNHNDLDGRDHSSSAGSSNSNSFVGGIVRVERSMGNFFNYLNVWVNSYSRRWLQHRESVTSTASFITLLSSKYHNKTHTVASV